jgi:hypothetical protein
MVVASVLESSYRRKKDEAARPPPKRPVIEHYRFYLACFLRFAQYTLILRDCALRGSSHPTPDRPLSYGHPKGFVIHSFV